MSELTPAQIGLRAALARGKAQTQQASAAARQRLDAHHAPKALGQMSGKEIFGALSPRQRQAVLSKLGADAAAKNTADRAAASAAVLNVLATNARVFGTASPRAAVPVTQNHGWDDVRADVLQRTGRA